MKKFLSTILAVVMVLGSMAMVVSANEADLADGIYVGTELQASFTAAQTAAAATATYLASEKNWSEARDYVKFMVNNDDKVVEMLEYVNENQAAMNEEMTDLNAMLDDMIEQDENSIFFNYLSYLNNYKSVLNAE